jgi:hypothetical protein
MTGDNDGTGNGTTGVDCDGTEGNVSHCVTIPNAGEVTFHWEYAGDIEDSDTDAFGYCLNGVSTQLSSPNPPPFGTPNGDASFVVLGGDELCFTMSSENADLITAPTVTITDFTGPPCELPSLTAEIILTQGVACMGDEDASLEVITDFGVEPLSYSWDVEGVEGSNPSGLSAGTYCVTVIDAVPDTSYVCYEITQASSELTASANSNPDDGTGTGMAFVSIAGGEPDHETVWDTDPVQTGPIVTGLDHGVYTYTIVDAFGCELVGQVEILYVGIEEISGLEQFELYPNPAQDIIHLSIAFDQNRDFTINIMNSLGQNILDITSTSGNQFNDAIDISELKSGFYYLNLEVDGYRMTKKIIVK